jgi:hypothetical protein
MQNILDWNSMMLTPWQKSPNSHIKLWKVKGFEHQLLDQSSICKQSGAIMLRIGFRTSACHIFLAQSTTESK